MTRARCILEIVGVCLLLTIIYYILRLPTAWYELAYYDDGETLYHTLAMLSGKVPYRDDINHHFCGYILPFVALAKAVGFSEHLTRTMAILSQVLMGAGVFLVIRLYFSFFPSLVGALLAISAREPWVLGFFLQNQINFLLIYTIFFSTKYIRDSSCAYLFCASFLCGIAVTFDQRAIIISLIPAMAFLLSTKDLYRKASDALFSVLSFAVPIGAALLYLYKNQALDSFYEQTWIFPTKYRIGSSSIPKLLEDALTLYRHLPEQTPILLVASLLGLIALLIKSKNVEEIPRRERWLFFVCLIPLGLMPAFGSRDFDYYTITWLPFLALLSIIGTTLLKSKKLRAVYASFLTIPVLLSLGTAIKHRNDGSAYTGDGVRETAAYLNQNMSATDTILVWGYRLDLYVYLRRLSAYRFANRLMIHPDPAITDEKLRAAHEFPPYVEEFLELLGTSPPGFVVLFENSQSKGQSSRSDLALRSILARDYSSPFTIEKKDLRGVPGRFTVFRRNDSQAKTLADRS